MTDAAGSPRPDEGAEAPTPHHWVAGLARFLREESGVEAILVDPADRTVAFATLGEVDRSALEDKLGRLLAGLESGRKPVAAAAGSGGTAGATGTLAGITVRRLPGETLIEKDSCPTAPSFWRWRRFTWPASPSAAPASAGSGSSEAGDDSEWRALALQAAVCGGALVLAWVNSLASGPSALGHSLYLVSIVAGAWDAAQNAAGKLARGQLDIHFIMLAVAAGAVAIGAYGEGALLLFLFSASGAMEHYALHRTHREISALTRAAPKTAHVVVSGAGATEDRDVASVVPGDLVLVKPGESFPVDGEVRSGATAADESNLTGEAAPVDKEVGDPVYSGTLNLWGAATVAATKPVTESALQRIIDLIERAQHLRAPSQRFTDRFGTPYTYAILGFTTLMFLVWWLGFGLPPFRGDGAPEATAFYRAMTLLVVASPCALVLSIPSAILAAIAWGARKGVLFRGGAAIENLATVDTVALDKTGTLTSGELQVDSIESFPPGREREVAEFAFALERNSDHPIARAITAYGQREGLAAREVTGFESLTGRGVRGEIDSETTYLGRRELLDTTPDLAPWISGVDEPPVDRSEVWVVRAELIGRVLLRDELRLESRGVLAALASRGIHTMMLTGDRRSAAESVARELGVADVRAGLHPDEKVGVIEELSNGGGLVAMVGDGVNDAPSLAAAHVSVAMGGRGSDAALEQADVVLMRDRIGKLLTALHVSTAARSVIRQNLAISLGTILVMVTLALLGKTHLTVGVLAHEGSTVLVCLNSLRLLFMKDEPAGAGTGDAAPATHGT